MVQNTADTGYVPHVLNASDRNGGNFGISLRTSWIHGVRPGQRACSGGVGPTETEECQAARWGMGPTGSRSCDNEQLAVANVLC